MRKYTKEFKIEIISEYQNNSHDFQFFKEMEEAILIAACSITTIIDHIAR